MKKWIFRTMGMAFFAAAALHYISYNTANADGSDPGALTLVFGLVWTVVIALPGIMLFAHASRD